MDTEQYTTGVGQTITVHGALLCVGEHCVIHNPSDHNMKDWPTLWRGDRGLMERVCEHGVGHPDPDHVAHTRKLRGLDAACVEGVHGCDGCCLKRGDDAKV